MGSIPSTRKTKTENTTKIMKTKNPMNILEGRDKKTM
jgi:hypothetical protein